jgi:hypothetical protein
VLLGAAHWVDRLSLALPRSAGDQREQKKTNTYELVLAMKNRVNKNFYEKSFVVNFNNRSTGAIPLDPTLERFAKIMAVNVWSDAFPEPCKVQECFLIELDITRRNHSGPLELQKLLIFILLRVRR